VRALFNPLTTRKTKKTNIWKSKLSASQLSESDKIGILKIAPKKKKAVKCAKRIGLPNSGAARKFLKRA
jgi:hypothetical protein